MDDPLSGITGNTVGRGRIVWMFWIFPTAADTVEQRAGFGPSPSTFSSGGIDTHGSGS
jgi:hypothetical protein